RLYGAGASPQSSVARARLTRFAAERPDVQLEVVDALAEPARALADAIVVTPTLLRIAPQPIHRIFGNLTGVEDLLAALGL
ncbi:MAG: circadian clock KaiB family protein, partial [Deltaproteobacteria bacterium]